MSQLSKTIVRPFKIVVGFDFSEQADLGLIQAIELAGKNPPSVVHVIGVVGHRHGLAQPITQKVRFSTAQEMQSQIEVHVKDALAARGRDGLHLFVHTRIGKVGEEILNLAREVEADLIIVGTHGRHGVKRAVLGSVSEQIMRNASCPVLVMRPRDYEAANEVALEPPCPRCVAVRDQTHGRQWWCDRHQGTYRPPSRYHYEQHIVETQDDDWALW
jgi:nucleotide-binding universal stress UspA family protein